MLSEGFSLQEILEDSEGHLCSDSFFSVDIVMDRWIGQDDQELSLRVV